MKAPKNSWGEDQLEGLAVLLHRVEEPQEAQAQDLDLVLGLRIFSRVLTLSRGLGIVSLHSFWACLCYKLCNSPSGSPQ